MPIICIFAIRFCDGTILNILVFLSKETSDWNWHFNRNCIYNNEVKKKKLLIEIPLFPNYFSVYDFEGSVHYNSIYFNCKHSTRSNIIIL